MDPQILADVIEGAFPVPGPTMKRTTRVRLGARSIANVACGGRALVVDGNTSDRYDQPRLADLELIGRKGLVENDPNEDRYVSLNGCEASDLPSFEAWSVLYAPWENILREVVRRPRVTITLGGVADCLRKATGFAVDTSDPTASFISHADVSQLRAGDWNATMLRNSRAYARCTPPYFTVLAAELMERRPAMVERNRELLQQMARELAAAGYLP